MKKMLLKFPNLRNAMKLHFVETMDHVLALALEQPLPEIPEATAQPIAAIARSAVKVPPRTSNAV